MYLVARSLEGSFENGKRVFKAMTDYTWTSGENGRCRDEKNTVVVKVIVSDIDLKTNATCLAWNEQ